MKLSKGKVPPGGWHFPLPGGGRLAAINEEALIKLIFEFRMRNNLPIGDIERDIDNYYCSQWPEACHPEVRDYHAQAAADAAREPILNRVTRWASLLAQRMPPGGYPLVTAEEADRRNAICALCPRQNNWRGGCAGCSSVTATLLVHIRQTRSSRQQGNLTGCDTLGWDNLTAVHLPLYALEIADSQKTELPDKCWRKNA